jgi:hypothetical protein
MDLGLLADSSMVRAPIVSVAVRQLNYIMPPRNCIELQFLTTQQSHACLLVVRLETTALLHRQFKRGSFAVVADDK